MSETWRDVVGFEGRYSVSNRGQVFSHVSNRALKLMFSKTRGFHPHVTLRVNGYTYGYAVHALVTAAFIGPMPPGLEVRHMNGNPRDNRWPENVEYSTRTRNMMDRKWHAGSSIYKLSPAQVADIKRRLGPLGMGAILAREYGVSQANISAIKHNAIHIDVAA